jgi:hypothetical protein
MRMNALSRRSGVVVHVTNAFAPERGRTVMAVGRPVTVRAHLDGHGVAEFVRPTICIFNGRALLRAEWTKTIIGGGDICTFVALPRGGGGGGGGGKNPLRTVMMIALMAVGSLVVGPMVGGMVTTWGGSTMAFGSFGNAILAGKIAGFMAGGLVSMAGNALVNALIPAPKPVGMAYSNSGYGAPPSPSPTYSIQGQGNSARLGQPVPAQYGRHRVFPDLIVSEPYSEFADNEQYLFQPHCLGLGDFHVEKIQIAETDIANFKEIEYEIVSPGGTATLFDVNVITRTEVSGQELKGTNELREGEDGHVGPFIANPVDTIVEHIGIDVVFPRGLYYANDGGGLDSRTITWVVEAREIDDHDLPVGAGTWTTLGADIAAPDISAAAADKSFNSTTTDYVAEGVAVGQRITTSGFANPANNGTWTVTTVSVSKITVSESGIVDEAAGASVAIVAAGESLSASTNTQQRRSYKYAASVDRIEVRARREDEKDTSSRAGHEIRWTALRAHVQGPSSFDGVTLLLVKMRATDNLSSRSARQINVIQTRKIPVWDGQTETWSAPTATRSIVWACADICRAEYGAELADQRLPLADLAALDSNLTGRGDYFDAVFDSKTTVWDALQRVARCGRAVPILQGGIVRLVRDGPQTLPVALFGPRNIVKGSLKIEYILPGDDTADAVTVEFFNQRTWKPDEITAKLADSNAEKPAMVTLFGCTVEAHAQREGDYMAADNRYRRKLVTFRTELEGMIPTYGDLIAVTHDLPRWGQGGEVVAWDDQSEILTLSESLDWTDGQTHYMALRKRDGSLAGPFQVEAHADEDTEVHLLEALTFTPYVGSGEERTHFGFGPGQAWSQLCRVLSVKPRNGGEQVEITAVAEDDRVHEADLAA